MLKSTPPTPPGFFYFLLSTFYFFRKFRPMKGGKDFRFCPANSQNRGDVGRQFARLCSLRVALVLSAGTGTLGAGEKPVEPSKVSITVTNQGYLELSLSLFQMVPPPTPTAAVVPGSPRPPTQPATHRVSIVRPATVQQKVKPNQGITFEIPEGSYAVHTSSSPQPGVLLPNLFRWRRLDYKRRGLDFQVGAVRAAAAQREQ